MLQIGFSVYALVRGLLPAAIVAVCTLASTAAAQDVRQPEPQWMTESARLAEAQRAHLWRVAGWGAANVVLGASLLAAGDRSRRPARHGFGVQSLAWGAINVGIATVGLSGGSGDLAASLADAMRAENAYADILLLNLGLNVGYAGVGGAMIAVGHRAGIASAKTSGALKGHGWALVLQGAGLFLLDGLAWLDGRDRLGRLFDLVETSSLAVGAGRVSLLISF